MTQPSASIPSAVPIPLRTISSTTLAEAVKDAVKAAKKDSKPLTVRCALGVYHEGDFRSWPGLRWIVEIPPDTAAVLQDTLTSFFRAVSTGHLTDLRQALDDWSAKNG